MKNIVFILLAVLLTSSIASAGWKDAFLTDYTTNELNAAVTNALAKGISPMAISEIGMTIDNMDGAVLVAAMCDGGVPVQALQDSLNVLGITQQAAINSCGGGQGSIAATSTFQGAAYSSGARGTTYGGNGGVGTGGVVAPPRTPSASGNNFDQ